MAPITTSDYVSAYGPFISPPIPITLNILIFIEAINTLYTTWSWDLGATIISFHALSPFFAAALLIVACIPPASGNTIHMSLRFSTDCSRCVGHNNSCLPGRDHYTPPVSGDRDSCRAKGSR